MNNAPEGNNRIAWGPIAKEALKHVALWTAMYQVAWKAENLMRGTPQTEQNRTTIEASDDMPRQPLPVRNAANSNGTNKLVDGTEQPPSLQTDASENL